MIHGSGASADVVVVGGGLAGLTAAALLARGGRRVTVFERSHAVGGRAATHVERGFHLNLGPHAWYMGWGGTRVLQDLGVPLPGAAPRPAGAFALYRGRLHTAPIGFLTLLTTDLLTIQGKLELGRVLASLPRLDGSAEASTPLAVWLDRHVHDRGARDVLGMLLRVSSYTNAPRRLSAGAALAAAQVVLRDNVRYLDGGWQSLVSSLRRIAEASGARVVLSSPVAGVLHGRAVEGVRLENGETIRAGGVIVAGTPAMVRDLLPGSPAITTAMDALVPSRAACLDIALTSLPRPGTLVAFGVDAPLYYSVHSASADLAPAGGAVVHVAKYLDPDEPRDAGRDERELETFMDRLQPGWRAFVVTRRYLPSMVVTHAIPTASEGGLKGRPAVDACGVDGLYLAGDWVGDEATLANAAVMSAARSAAALLAKESVAAA